MWRDTTLAEDGLWMDVCLPDRITLNNTFKMLINQTRGTLLDSSK
jgi:hypothetical protein